KPLSLVLLFLLWPNPAQAWEPIPKPPAAAPLAWVATDPDQNGTLWAASTHELFHADSLAQPFSGWRDAGALAGPQKIKRLEPQNSGDLFILTDDSVFLRSKASHSFQPVFKRASESAASLLAFTTAAWPTPVWFAGTTEGLFISQDQGKTWSAHLSLGHSKPVSFLASAGDAVFIRVENILYRAKSLEKAEVVFRFTEPEPLIENDPASEYSEDEVSAPFFESVFLASAHAQHLWLTGPQGLAESIDHGRKWALLPLAGLTDQPLRALAYAEKSQLLFAAAGSHVYAYRESDQRWYALPQNFQGKLLSLHIREGSPDTLIAAAENALLSQPIIPEKIFPVGQNLIPPEYESLFQKKIAGEPSPQAVQQAVVRYGNLTNSKISRWHKESRLRALLPSFSFGRDFSQANTFDLDRGGTADPDRYIAGPDDIDEGWSADVSWDLGDLIWSASQTSIDIREKLMVDQRRDFLAEAIRIYFERRRLQSELFFSSSNEVRTAYEKQLRLDELTALLDAMTGGWFSREIKKRGRVTRDA
ncbi:MAG: hypothetical protein KBC91_02485, partial [Candidatus Omnitrophica bacterium]|nr:hypothetical protein [Candidatus Omnitrophota bacterium]